MSRIATIAIKKAAADGERLICARCGRMLTVYVPARVVCCGRPMQPVKDGPPDASSQPPTPPVACAAPMGRLPGGGCFAPTERSSREGVQGYARGCKP